MYRGPRKSPHKRSKPRTSATITEKGMNKYNVHGVVAEGVQFDSPAEARHYLILQDDLRKGLVTKIVYHPLLQANINGQWICSYEPDFLVTYADGHEEIHEVKGFMVRDFGLRYRLMRALYPQYTFVLFGKKIKVGKKAGQYRQMVVYKPRAERLS